MAAGAAARRAVRSHPAGDGGDHRAGWPACRNAHHAAGPAGPDRHWRAVGGGPVREPSSSSRMANGRSPACAISSGSTRTMTRAGRSMRDPHRLPKAGFLLTVRRRSATPAIRCNRAWHSVSSHPVTGRPAGRPPGPVVNIPLVPEGSLAQGCGCRRGRDCRPAAPAACRHRRGRDRKPHELLRLLHRRIRMGRMADTFGSAGAKEITGAGVYVGHGAHPQGM